MSKLPVDSLRMRFRPRQVGPNRWAVFVGNTKKYYKEPIFATHEEALIEALKRHAIALDDEIRAISEYLIEKGEVTEDDPRGFLA